DAQQVRFGDMGRIPLKQLEALRVRLNCHDLRFWPPLVAEDGETANVGADVDDCADIVVPQLTDLVLVLEDRVGVLSAGRLNIEVASERLKTSRMTHSFRPPSIGCSSIGICSCSSQRPFQMPSAPSVRW